jgi:hypothetical protein
VFSVRTEDLPAGLLHVGEPPLGRKGLREVSTTEHATYPGQDKSCWGRASGAHDLFPI